MLNNLYLYNYSSETDLKIENCSAEPFILETCQRSLVLYYSEAKGQPGYNFEAHGVDAYRYLLEIICGLQSKLIAESEIVSQFKQAYKNYLDKPKRQSEIIRVLEKLFKDAKTIRTDFLKGICQKTYSYIARKNLVGKYQGKEVLILGSGKMAEDLILQMNKKTKVFLSARNTQKANQLKEQYNIELIDWSEKENFSRFSHIANTIGFNGQLFGDSFFDTWEKNHRRKYKLFLDLGSPSCIQTPMTLSEGVMRLENIFEEGNNHQKQQTEQIYQAQKNLIMVAQRRHELFQGSRRNL